MITVCPLCEDAHTVVECPHLQTSATWSEDGGPDVAAVQAGDEEALRALLAARALHPLVRTLAEAQREVRVLETVNTDDEQRRRLSRSRKLVKAIRHVRHRRMEMVDIELAEAERARRNDPVTTLVAGFVRTIEGKAEEALVQLAAVADTVEDGDDLGDFDLERLRTDARMAAGRNLLQLSSFEEARRRFEEVVASGEVEERAEARYQIARCLLAAAGTGEEG